MTLEITASYFKVTANTS